MIHITGGYGAPAGTALSSASATAGTRQGTSQAKATAGNSPNADGQSTTPPATTTPPPNTGANNSPYVISVSADIRADSTARYYLKPNRNYFFDDTTALSINGKHLLSTGNALALDETPNIIATSVGLAAQAFMPGPTAAAGIAAKTVSHAQAEKTARVSEIVGPMQKALRCLVWLIG
jgi:hypothetical protein